MSSSEEYLDSLLKSLTEGGSTAGAEPGASIMQDTADDLQNSDVAESAASNTSDETMSMDDIEAMFASMGMDAPEEEPVADGSAVDDGMIADELSLDDGLLSGELGLEEASPSDEMLPENVGMEEQVVDDFALIDEMLSDELPLEAETAMDDISLGDEPVVDDLVLEESGEEESMPDDFALEESGEEESMPDDFALEESGEEEAMPDDFALEESGEEPVPDDFALEESGEEESVPDDFALEESGEEESASDELSLEELGLGDLGLEELGLGEIGQETEEEQFALEESAEEESVALEDTGEEDADLSALLASMGGDADLSEINDLLEKSEQGVAVDDDMMAMLDGMADTEEGEGEGAESFDFFSGEEREEGGQDNIREITPEELAERENSKTKKQKKKEEKERKKREKKAKKAKGGESGQGENADGESSDDLSNLLGEAGENEEPKKQGFFARFISFLLEEDDEEEGERGSVEGDSEDIGVVIGNLSDENKELLEELKAEDKKNAKKKEKEDKKKNKKDKGKKKAGKPAADGEGDEEGEAKPKSKKPKKEKKKKEKNIEEELKLPEKKLSKKKVTSVFLFCASIAACIIVFTMLLPQQMEKEEARIAFDRSQYEQVYSLLYGKELSEEDEILLKKSSTILKMQRKLDSYQNYKKMDMQLEALNALIEGVSRYQNLRDDAVTYNVSGEVADIYGQILDALASDYGLSEADALDIISSGDDVTYSQRIQAVISGEVYGAEEAQPEGKQDVLLEEEEIIERLDNTDTAE